MKYEVVYVVMNEGEVVYASKSKRQAEAYTENQAYKARQRVLQEWGNDDPTEEDMMEADFQAGFDGDYYEVERVDLSNLNSDDMVELSDGTEIEVSEILEQL